MRPDDIFDALADIDEELIACAKHIDGGDSQVIVMRRTPLWKTIMGWSAAAACLAVLVVGGIFGIKYFSGKNTLSPPASGMSNADVSHSKSGCMTYKPCEYPAEAKYVYTGDYHGLSVNKYALIDYIPYADIDALEEASDLIVVGEFVDDPHQCVDPNESNFMLSFMLRNNIDQFYSFNTFRIDKVVKGRCYEGEKIIICQNGIVCGGEYLHYSDLTPMLKGDKWVYFLSKCGESYSPLGYGEGRYPVPGTEHKFVLNDNVYGVFGTCSRSEIYEEIKKRLPDWKYEPDNAELDFLVSKDFDGIELTVEMKKTKFEIGKDVWVKATVRNNTDKPIGLLMPCMGEGSHTEIGVNIERAARWLPDISVSGVFADAMDSHIVEPGGEYVQEMIFGTAAEYFDYAPAVPGVYNGTAGISLLTDPNDTSSGVTRCSVEFALELIGDEVPAIEKVFDYYNNGDIPDDLNVEFTMSEFPNVTFTASRIGVFANDEQLFGSTCLYSVYLCDMNGDGKREIISCCNSENYKGLLYDFDFIKVCDFANDHRLYRFCDDPFFYDTWLAVKDDCLIAMRTCKADYSPDRETSEFPLSFDMLEKYPELSKPEPDAVRNYTSLLNNSRSYQNEDKYLFVYRYVGAPENEPVYSTVNGEVVETGNNIGGLGSYIAVLAEDGRYYYYAALNDITASVGDRVTAGTVIGTVGMSGVWAFEDGFGARYLCTEYMLEDLNNLNELNE